MDQYLPNVNLKPYFENQYLLGILTLILILYGSFSQQTLPNFMYQLLDNPFFNFIIYLIIAFVGTQDIKSAFVVALIYAVLMHNFNQKKINEAFISGLKNEGFHDYTEEIA